jgi:hypothetical protein
MSNPNYQSIGAVSPELAAATDPKKGWQGAAGEPQGQQLQAHDISFWNKRANHQDLGAGTGLSYAEDFFGPTSDGDTDRTENAGYGNLQDGEKPLAGYGIPTLGPKVGTGDIVPFKGILEIGEPGSGIISGADASQEQSGSIGLSPSDRSP